MEELLGNVELDPLLSPIGLVVVLLGIRMVLGAFKTAIKLLFVLVILAGAYFFFYGGNLT